MQPVRETTLEIYLQHLEHNFNYINKRINSATKIMGVVKAFAYGSDSVTIAKKLEQLKVDYLAVAYVAEGVQLRDNGIQTPILVLHPQTVNFSQIVERCLEPNIYSPLMLERFIAYAEKEKLENYPIHIKINTGMNRIGFAPNHVDAIAATLSKTKSVSVKSVFSHLAASEDLENRAFSENQIQKFIQASERLIALLGYTPLRHMLNTSGILNFPEAQFDMVRTGIGLYGFGNDPKENKHLKPVAVLKTIVSQIHHIKKGESVGYNFGFVAAKDTLTATLPIGHADGISRSYGKGRGFVYINGKKAPMIGNICMDMLMIDVTEINCEEGDEVIVFGQQSTAEDFAASINSISYEILTAISPRVKRVVIEN